jgi:hypothetical protein
MASPRRVCEWFERVSASGLRGLLGRLGSRLIDEEEPVL